MTDVSNSIFNDLPREIRIKVVEFVPFRPQTTEELQNAVDLWCEDREKAEMMYWHINTWDVRKVEDVSFLFADKYEFNDDISNWDVSNVKNMDCMFYGCTEFNQSIEKWKVSISTSIDYAFFKAKKIPKWYINIINFNNRIDYDCYR